MTNYYDFAQVDDIKVLLDPGTMSFEPRLLFMDGKKKVEMTLNSNIYENLLGEFMLHTGLGGEYKEIAERVMNEVASNVEQLDYWKMFTLKSKYKAKLMNAIKEEEKLGNYMPK